MKIIYSPFPSEKEAKLVAQKLIENALVGCVNIIPSLSLYKWEGKIVEDNESIILCKTKDSAVNDVINLIRENHPYSLPAIITLATENVNDEYNAWINAVVK